jgi:hypothetical protein
MRRLHGDVLWSDVPTACLPDRIWAGCDTVNAALDEAAARWANLTIARWSAVAKRKHYGKEKLWRIQLSLQGQIAFGDFITSPLNRITAPRPVELRVSV